MNKSFLTWIQIRNWCELNPEKTAAIITPFGRFEIRYFINKPKDIKLETMEFINFD